MKGYRKIKYFTEREAEQLCDRRNGDARREGMVGSYYDTEQLEEGWVINHYVLRTLVRQEAKNGYIPHDHDPHYREGYIFNGASHDRR